MLDANILQILNELSAKVLPSTVTSDLGNSVAGLLQHE
jgi:hypothetical protein